MDLSIIIINWNSRDYVAACLGSIFTYPPPIAFEVIVLDSGSFDGCGEMIARHFPQVRFIQHPENLGFSRANNLAVTLAQGNTFFFLNPDTEVHCGAIMALLATAQGDPSSGAVGARLLNTDCSLQTSCIQSFPTLLNQLVACDFLLRMFPRSRLWGRAPLYKSGLEPRAADAVSGAALMMRRNVFLSIGRFDEAYFMYSEDIELCYRAREAGFVNRYIPQSVVTHHGGGSSRNGSRHFASVAKTSAIYTFLWRTRGPVYAFCYRIIMVFVSAIRIAVSLIAATLPQASRRCVWLNSVERWWHILKWALAVVPPPSGNAVKRHNPPIYQSKQTNV